VVAAGREVVVLVFYGVRDHRIRYLPARPGPGRREHAWRTRGRRGSFRVMTPAPGLIGCGVVAPCDDLATANLSQRAMPPAQPGAAKK
jgi:hypothetical protein